MAYATLARRLAYCAAYSLVAVQQGSCLIALLWFYALNTLLLLLLLLFAPPGVGIANLIWGAARLGLCSAVMVTCTNRIAAAAAVCISLGVGIANLIWGAARLGLK
jgi:hypothetical protein